MFRRLSVTLTRQQPSFTTDAGASPKGRLHSLQTVSKLTAGGHSDRRGTSGGKSVRVLEGMLRAQHLVLEAVEHQLVQNVRNRLDAHKADSPRTRDIGDVIFAPHTTYVQWALQRQLVPAERPVQLWHRLLPEVETWESTHHPIHKGAPLFNIGLCHFVLGDFARASQYITEASEEDQRSGRGASTLVTGASLGRGVFRDPLFPWLASSFSADYQAATGIPLDAGELDSLVEFLEGRQTDAMVFLSALHRLKAQMEPPDNIASGLQRVRALADLPIVLESNLQRRNVGSGTLFGRCRALVNGTDIRTSFDTRKAQHPTRAWWETAANVSRAVTEEIAAFGAATTRADKAGIALYLSYRLRNALLHSLDGTLDLYSQSTPLTRVVGFALVSVRLSKFEAAGQLGTI